MSRYIILLSLMSCTDIEDTSIVNEVTNTGATEDSLFQYSGPKPANLLMLSIDTWRQDQIDGSLRSKEKMLLSPFLSSLAADGVYLSNHHSVSSWTYPSIAAALSGQDLVSMNFVPALGAKPGTMPSTATFLPTLLSNKGYTTGLVTANGFLCSQYGIGDEYAFEQCLTKGGVDFDAYAVRTRGLALAKDLSSGKAPWFLHLHFIDPHLPYNPPKSYLNEAENLASVSFDFTTAGAQGLQMQWDLLTTREQKLFLAHTKARYHGLTRYLDDQIKALLSDLTEQGLLEDTLVVLFSDHGEQLFEHGMVGHTQSVHSHEIHVPVAFWAKDLLPANWDGLTSHHDLVPTILDQLEIKIPGHITGISAGGQTPDTVIFSHLMTGTNLYISASTENHKLIYGWHDGSKQLYDTTSDHDEQNNIYDTALEVTKHLWQALDEELLRLQPFVSITGPIDAGL
jgi:arylsulfatase A-like enzyme